MAVRDVILAPDARLTVRCTALLDAPRAEIERIAQDLVDTMRAHPGCVGIAAPQIGELVRMVAVDVTGAKRARSSHGLLVMIDPVVDRSSAERVSMREGCLSIPDLTGNVTRAESVLVSSSSPDGPLHVAADAYEARVILHELDHLNGVLFLDRVASAADVFARKRYR